MQPAETDERVVWLVDSIAYSDNPEEDYTTTPPIVIKYNGSILYDPRQTTGDEVNMITNQARPTSYM